jgi:hypothetical protein
MTTNRERAEVALEPLRLFHGLTRTKPLDLARKEEIADLIADLICDLGHFADQHDLDVVAILEDAAGMWHAEKHDPDEEPDANDVASLTIVRAPRNAKEIERTKERPAAGETTYRGQAPATSG